MQPKNFWSEPALAFFNPCDRCCYPLTPRGSQAKYMTQQKNKRATVKSAKKEAERQAYEKITGILEDVLSSSTTKTFKKQTLRDAAAITTKAAANSSSLHAARKHMKKGKSRRQAAKTLESLDIDKTVDQANRHLKRQARQIFADEEIETSADIHDVPYHGDAFKEESEVRGCKQKDGTRHCHSFATAYANKRGKRITLAMLFVRKGESMASVVKRLLDLVRRIGLQVKLLLLDKGFFSVDVFRLLIRANVPFIVPLKGNRLKKKRGSYKTFYTVKTAAGGTAREVRLRAYSVVKYDAGKRFKKKGSRRWCYVTFRVDAEPLKLAEMYRKRFGIESSYKLSKKVRARTSSRNPAYRFFLLAASFFLQNVWVEVKMAFCWRVKKWSASFISLRDFADVLLAVIREEYGEAATFASPH